MKKASAVIPAAGRGERFGSRENKVFAEVAGKPLLAHTLSAFETCEGIGEVILVVGERDVKAAADLVRRFGCAKVAHVVPGGAHRQDSVRQGLVQVKLDVVAIHDGARPLVTSDLICRCIRKARQCGACIAAVPVIDTIKAASADGVVTETVDRGCLYAVQTPQTFRTELIRRAYEQAFADGFYATDDAALVERMGGEVAVELGSYENIKVTTPADLHLVEAALGGGEVRTGFGFDVHQLVAGRKLVLGGIELDFEKGLAGHSDADVVLHAIADACLGAAALGDIGRHFPDTDPKYEGVSSVSLLGEVAAMISSEGWSVVNVDVVLGCQRPKIAPKAHLMIEVIAKCLGTMPDRVSVKATTTEGLGYIGREEGIACYAVATLRRSRATGKSSL